MDTDRVDIPARHAVPRHRIPLHEYHRLAETGILGEDDRVALLEGQLVDMSPIGPRHALPVDALNELLVPAVAGRAVVRVQNPIALDGLSEPQPDIVVVRRPWLGYPAAHPQPGDIFLLIEVADTTLATDVSALRQSLHPAVLGCRSGDEQRAGLSGPNRRQVHVDDQGGSVGRP
jgi:Uma2 family endonuclease